MALTVGTDSYVSVSEADTFFTGYYGADQWAAATAADKEKALFTATEHIDRLALLGRKKDPLQVLQFPRCYSTWVEGEPVEICDTDVLPNVKRACCEEALSVMRGETVSKRALLQQQGVTSSRVGRAAETYSGVGAMQTLASQAASDYLRPYVKSVAGLG